MSTLTAALVGAALLSVFVVFFIRTRRMERDVDFAELSRRMGEDDGQTLLSRIIANSIVASP